MPGGESEHRDIISWKNKQKINGERGEREEDGKKQREEEEVLQEDGQMKSEGRNESVEHLNTRL